MQIITPQISDALAKAKIAFGSNIKLALALGISDSLLSRILHGRASHFSDQTWQRVEPILRPYLRLCPKGHGDCPYEGAKELKTLMESLVDVNDPDFYSHLNDLVVEWKQHQKSAP